MLPCHARPAVHCATPHCTAAQLACAYNVLEASSSNQGSFLPSMFNSVLVAIQTIRGTVDQCCKACSACMQDDWEGYTALNAENVCQIVGDDLLVTNPDRVQTAIDKKACNALLLKVNQIGSVTESINAVRMAKEAGWGVMTSHRSGTSAPSLSRSTSCMSSLCQCVVPPGVPEPRCRGSIATALLRGNAVDLIENVGCRAV